MDVDKFLADLAARGVKATAGKSANFALFPAVVKDESPPPADCDEEAFRARYIKVAKELGWEHYHTYNSRRSAHGFPDDWFGREWGQARLIVLEAKVPPNKPTKAQQRWLRILLGAGIDARLVYPHDWPTILEALKRP